MGLDSMERAKLRQFLAKYFGLPDLKNLAFDLGVDFELFAHETTSDFSRELIAYLERRSQLNCLIVEVMRLRSQNNELAQR